MLELTQLEWVIPAVIFIWVCRRGRNSLAISVSGWSYVFSLVVIAYGLDFCFPLVEKYFFVFSNKIIGKGVLAAALAYLFSRFYVMDKIIPINDLFVKNCLDWEEKSIILSLKNNKIYIGYLNQYTEDPKSRHESQMLSIYPIISGIRNQTGKKVEWNLEYPTDDKSKCEMFIPRNEIVSFGKYNKNVFDHFNPADSKT